ncbi:hypothetical protein HY631_02400 [Candidatus Uhrbacteria bacterium]|nr:hypothetical protein [Candidatus Uhrbacteria bacterium]
MITPSKQLVVRTTVSLAMHESLFLPLWWYSRGLLETAEWLLASVRGSVKFFGVDVWVKNLFVPMYGDASIPGRFISFGVRLSMVVVRGAGAAAWSVLAVVLLFAYVFVFPLVLFGFFAHLIGVLA